MNEIRFGTDGWRAVLGEGFTFASLRRVALATARTLREDRVGGPVVVGYDRRFLGRRLAREAAGILRAQGLEVLLSDEPVPTPAVSRAVLDRGAALGVVLTASHNPPEWNGYKLKGPYGGSVDEDYDRRVEAALPERDPPPPEEHGFPPTPLMSPYRESLARAIDGDVLREANFLALADPMHGASGRIVEEVAGRAGLEVRTLRAGRDPLFGGRPPEPVPANLLALGEEVRRQGARAGLATDGDGDRLAAVDETGAFVSPLLLLPLLVLYLHRHRGRRGSLVKTFANTSYLDRIGAALGATVRTEPVGFKHAVAWMRREEVLAAGEESGGIAVGGGIPERDGALVSLLLLELMASRGRSLRELVRELRREFGELHYRRLDLPLAAPRAATLTRRLAADPPSRLAGLPVEAVDERDGTRLAFPEGQWLLLRASGTEPLLRIYAETESLERLEAVMDEARRLARDLAEELSSPPR
jgi:phosphomannomutase